MSEKKLRKVRVQYVGHDIKGNEVKEDVDVYTTADAVTMDQQPLKEAIAKMISNTAETIVGGASEEYNSLKQIENKFEKTVLKDDISHDYKDDDIDKVLSTHGANIVLSDMVEKLDKLVKTVYDIAYANIIYSYTSGMGSKLNEVFKLKLSSNINNIDDLTKSQADTKKVADNPYAIEAGIRSDYFLLKVSSSQTAMNAVASSQTAMNAVGKSSMAIGKLAAGLAKLNPKDFADMNAVASSQTAMNAVASSQTAMNAVASSQTAMNAVASSQTAMTNIVNKCNAVIALSPDGPRAGRFVILGGQNQLIIDSVQPSFDKNLINDNKTTFPSKYGDLYNVAKITKNTVFTNIDPFYAKDGYWVYCLDLNRLI